MTLECPSQKALKKFFLGHLDPDSLRNLRKHADQCAECEKTVSSIQAVRETLIENAKSSSKLELSDDEGLRMALKGSKLSFRQLLKKYGVKISPDVTIPPELIRLSEYKIVKKLGEGGMGAVYKAIHKRLDKIVALKTLRPDRFAHAAQVSRFEREMKAVGRLDHPNLIRAHDAGEIDSMHYLVMEYVDGIDLNEAVKQHRSLPIQEACEAIRQAALGLQHAHENSLVHRDIKPSNIMVTKKGIVKVLDMGLARIGSQISENDLTSAGQVMGTIDYMSPEQAESSHEVDIRADIYALGATLYKIISGRVPFAGKSQDSVVKKLIALSTEVPDDIRNHARAVPDGLAKLIHQMLEKDPANRPQEPIEVAQQLAQFAAGHSLPNVVDPNASFDPVASARNAQEQLGEHAPLPMGVDSSSHLSSGSSSIVARNEASTPSNASTPHQDPEQAIRDELAIQSVGRGEQLRSQIQKKKTGSAENLTSANSLFNQLLYNKTLVAICGSIVVTIVFILFATIFYFATKTEDPQTSQGDTGSQSKIVADSVSKAEPSANDEKQRRELEQKPGETSNGMSSNGKFYEWVLSHGGEVSDRESRFEITDQNAKEFVDLMLAASDPIHGNYFFQAPRNEYLTEKAAKEIGRIPDLINPALNRVTVNQKFMESFPRSKEMTRLNFNDAIFKRGAFRTVSKFYPNLETLMVFGEFEEKDLSFVNNLSVLTQLYLDLPKGISVEAIKNIAKSNVTGLTLIGFDLEPAMAAELANCKSVETIRFNAVDAASIGKIAQIPSIQKIEVNVESPVDEATVQEVANRFPAVRFTYRNRKIDSQ